MCWGQIRLSAPGSLPDPEVRDSQEPSRGHAPSSDGGAFANWRAAASMPLLLELLSSPIKGTWASLLPISPPNWGEIKALASCPTRGSPVGPGLPPSLIWQPRPSPRAHLPPPLSFQTEWEQSTAQVALPVSPNVREIAPSLPLHWEQAAGVPDCSPTWLPLVKSAK